MTSIPGYWMNETGPVLRPAVLKYLDGGLLNALELAAFRSYLRQWIDGDFRGDEVLELRAAIDSVRTTAELRAWLNRAYAAGVDPL